MDPVLYNHCQHHFITYIHFCLRPSAKDQGITWVVVLLVVLHLVHFLTKRNLRGKNSPQPGYEPGTSRSTVWHSTNWARETLLLMCLKIIYLFQKSRRRPWTSIGQPLVVLVVVVVLLHLVHFLIKRNLREKNLPSRDSNWGPPDPQPSTYPLS